MNSAAVRILVGVGALVVAAAVSWKFGLIGVLLFIVAISWFFGPVAFLATMAFVLFMILNWVLWLRVWLKNQPWPWSQRYFDWFEPAEILLYKKSRTILWARTQFLIAMLPSLIGPLMAFNNPELIALLPDQWEKYALLFFVVLTVVSSVVQEINRGNTDTALDVVALPTQLDHKPEVAEAVAKLDVAKAEIQDVLKAEKVQKAAVAEAVAKPDKMEG